jgi:hypothetical protein
MTKSQPLHEAVLRIRDILVRTEQDPALFVSDLQDPTNIFFAYYFRKYIYIILQR